ncbi:type II toxin-antitoxin system RelE/ParE family toxin [Azospirillum fermentarium]|uniref:type II toxin-antitoxin system RelE/ParE family toxin n=1 Tax=Azospirillum fermentarium TaxID=1233114 RepID=UPI003872A7F9
MTVVWAIRAVRDVEQHVAYLAEVNPIAARELAQTLISLGDSLSVFPLRGRVGRIPGSRELLAASPYIIRLRGGGQ